MVAELLVVLIGVQPHAVRSPPALPRERVPLRREVEDNGLYTKCSGLKWKRSGSDMMWNHIRIQTYSKRILLNTPRIQDSRFKVPGRTLPCTLNLESWIRGVFNRIRLNTIEYVHGESFVLKHKEETYDLQALPRSHEPTPCLPKAETEQTGVGTWGGGVPYIYIYPYLYLYLYRHTYMVIHALAQALHPPVPIDSTCCFHISWILRNLPF